MRASCSPTIGPGRTITGLRDQWEVCIHGEETLGTSLCNISTPACGSKRSGSGKKATALGAPHAKKKRRLNGPDEKRGRGGGGDTQSQAPTVARRSQGQQEQPTRGRGGQKARRAMTVAFEKVIGGEQGLGMGSKVDDTEFGQQTQLQYDALDLFDYGDAPPLSPSPTSTRQASASLQHNVEDDVSNGGNAARGPVSRVQGRQFGGGERCSLLLLLVVVVDVVVVVVLRKLQILKDGGGTGHQRCGRCSKATQLGQATLSMWKQRTS